MAMNKSEVLSLAKEQKVQFINVMFTDPRGILKRQLKRAADMGYSFNTGPELEFFLFKRSETGELKPLPHDTAGYFDQATDLATEIRKEMTFALHELGIDVEALHYEVA